MEDATTAKQDQKVKEVFKSNIVLDEIKSKLGVTTDKEHTFDVSGISITIKRIHGEETARAESLILRKCYSEDTDSVDMALYESLKRYFYAGFATVSMKGQKLEAVFDESDTFLATISFIDFLLLEAPTEFSSAIYDKYTEVFGSVLVLNDNKIIYRNPKTSKVFLFEDREEPYYCSDTGTELEKVENSLPLL